MGHWGNGAWAKVCKMCIKKYAHHSLQTLKNPLGNTNNGILEVLGNIFDGLGAFFGGSQRKNFLSKYMRRRVFGNLGVFW